VFYLVLFLLGFATVIPIYTERTPLNPITLTWVSFYFPVLVFDSQLSTLFYVYSLCCFTIFFICFYLAKYLTQKVRAPISDYQFFQSSQELKLKVLALFLFGTVLFLKNLTNVVSTYGLNAYVSVSPKDIELAFGSSTIMNYLFFINMILPSIITLLIRQNLLKPTWYILAFLCLVYLGFTGIKSTLLFGLSIFAMTFFLCQKKIPIKLLVVFTMFVLGLIYALFLVVNVGLSSEAGLSFEAFLELIFGYVGYNYLNLDLEINSRQEYMLGKYTFVFITKLVEPEMRGGYFASTDLILTNPNFNMGTFLREYFVDFGYIGSMIVVGIIAAYGAVLQKFIRFKSYALVWFSIYLTAALFAFFGNQFIRLQFIVLMIQSYMILRFLSYKFKF
jgi:oligosaccharide repeat unit polymerase